MDDDEKIREFVKRILKSMGHKVELAIDGTETIEMFRKAKESGTPFDVVIMDLTIPGGMGGKEAVKKLIEIAPEVRAIVLSKYSNDPVMSNYREFGFRDLITKHYRIKNLSETLPSADFIRNLNFNGKIQLPSLYAIPLENLIFLPSGRISPQAYCDKCLKSNQSPSFRRAGPAAVPSALCLQRLTGESGFKFRL